MQVTPHVHMLRLPFTIRVSEDTVLERSVNMFIITGPAITLIDTGVAGSEEVIFDYIRSIGRDPAEIALLILTHSHPDHIGSARAIRQATGCIIAAHAAERAWIEDIGLQCTSRPVPGFHSLVGGSVPVGQLLEDGDTLALGDDSLPGLIVFHTPGHSPGSISLLLRSEGVLLTGDAVPVTGDIPVYDDVLASVQSIKRLIGIDGIRVLLSAWDEPREGICAYQKMREAFVYLQKIHTAVIRNADLYRTDPLEHCRRTAAALGLPPQAVTPLLARTFAANLQLYDRPQLLIDEEALQPEGPVVEGARSERKLLL